MIASISMRHYMSISHLQTMFLLAKKCDQIENSGDQCQEEAKREHRGYATSSVIMSAAFLEATINEFFSDTGCQHGATNISDPKHKSLLAKLWSRGIPRTASYSILEKYDIALELLEKEAFNQSTNPYQNIKLLIELRNALIHYEPETVSSNPLENSKKLEKFQAKFRGKFPDSKIAPVGALIYPDKMLGAGCAHWAKNSAIAYTDAFFEAIGVDAPYSFIVREYCGGN